MIPCYGFFFRFYNFLLHIKNLYIPIIKIIWTTKKWHSTVKLHFTALRVSLDQLAFLLRSSHSIQLPPSPTNKFFSFPVVTDGSRRGRERIMLSVVLHSLMWKGWHSHLNLIQCFALQSWTAKRSKIRQNTCGIDPVHTVCHPSIRLACLLLLFNHFFFKGSGFSLAFLLSSTSTYRALLNLSHIGLVDMAAEPSKLRVSQIRSGSWSLDVVLEFSQE